MHTFEHTYLLSTMFPHHKNRPCVILVGLLMLEVISLLMLEVISLLMLEVISLLMLEVISY